MRPDRRTDGQTDRRTDGQTDWDGHGDSSIPPLTFVAGGITSCRNKFNTRYIASVRHIRGEHGLAT